MIVRGWSWIAVLGRSIPNAPNNAFSTIAIPTPATMPSTDADQPDDERLDDDRRHHLTAARPDRSEQGELLPRWATMIENVLKMMNAPDEQRDRTRRPAGTSGRSPSPSFNCSDCSSATVGLVSASVFGGRTCWIWARSCPGATPSSPTTEMESNTPSLSRTRWAVGVSNRASVAPPRLSASPNPAMPLIVNSSGAIALEQDRDRRSRRRGRSLRACRRRRRRPRVRSAARLPGARGWRWCRSSWCRSWAGRPRRWHRRSRGPSSARIPGRPPHGRSRRRRTALDGRRADLRARDRVLRHRRHRDRSREGANACSASDDHVAARRSRLANRSSNALFIVSVSTNVPTTNPTPSTIETSGQDQPDACARTDS